MRRYNFWRLRPSAFAAFDSLKRAPWRASSNHLALHPVPQCRQADRDDVPPVVEILTDPPLPNRPLEIAVGRCDDPGICAKNARPTKAVGFALLQDSKELRLRRGAHFRHFVEKQRAARGHFRLGSGLL
jgi:hypothetical protein